MMTDVELRAELRREQAHLGTLLAQATGRLTVCERLKQARTLLASAHDVIPEPGKIEQEQTEATEKA